MAIQSPIVLASGFFSQLFPGDTVPGTDTTAQASGNAALVLAGTALASGNAGISTGLTALASGNAGLVSASNKVPISGGYMTGQLFAASGVVVSGTLSRNGFNVVTVGDVETVTSTMIASGTIIDADVNISGAINATKLRFLQAGASGVARTVDSKLKDVVSVKDFGAVGDGTTNDTAAIQAALDSGAKYVCVEGTCKVTTTVNLVSNQTLLFKQGNIVAFSGGLFTDGVLYALNKQNCILIDPIIDATTYTTTGIPGIQFKDSPESQIKGGLLLRGSLVLSATTTNRMGYLVDGTIVDQKSVATNPCVFVSAANGVTLSNLETFNGQFGIGIYNNAKNINQVNCISYGHAQDGFVIIQGSRVNYTNCIAHNNIQSGFTTQRLTAGTDCQYVTYSSCNAYSNTVDGFDLRGGNATVYSEPMFTTCSSCIATNNGGNGFYMVYNQAAVLSSCEADANGVNGFSIDTSSNSILTGCASYNNCQDASVSGTAKSGLAVYLSNNAQINGCVSTNISGASQSYGVSFYGTSEAGCVTGGFYEGNAVSPYYLEDKNRLVGAKADTLAGVGVFLLSISQRGIFTEEGFGAPAHTRPKGSTFMRLDGGFTGELYISNGGGTWRLV